MELACRYDNKVRRYSSLRMLMEMYDGLKPLGFVWTSAELINLYAPN